MSMQACRRHSRASSSGDQPRPPQCCRKSPPCRRSTCSTAAWPQRAARCAGASCCSQAECWSGSAGRGSAADRAEQASANGMEPAAPICSSTLRLMPAACHQVPQGCEGAPPRTYSTPVPASSSSCATPAMPHWAARCSADSPATSHSARWPRRVRAAAVLLLAAALSPLPAALAPCSAAARWSSSSCTAGS